MPAPTAYHYDPKPILARIADSLDWNQLLRDVPMLLLRQRSSNSLHDFLPIATNISGSNLRLRQDWYCTHSRRFYHDCPIFHSVLIYCNDHSLYEKFGAEKGWCTKSKYLVYRRHARRPAHSLKEKWNRCIGSEATFLQQTCKEAAWNILRRWKLLWCSDLRVSRKARL